MTVELHEPVKGSKEVKGSLMGRDDSFVRLSLKGRIVKIPHSNVSVIRLPKAKYEQNDYEIRKLQ